jgi:hypothetical protein
VNRYGALLRELHQERMLFPAGRAPGREDIDERYLAPQIGARQAERATLDRGQLKLGRRFADGDEGEPLRVQRFDDEQSDSDYRADGGERQDGEHVSAPPTEPTETFSRYPTMAQDAT